MSNLSLSWRFSFFRMKSKILNYVRLARLDKPIGIYLLLWPSLLGLLLGAISRGSIDFENILIVVVGSILVRSCGCVINDISDRNFDKVVERTKERPLASGNISLGEAWVFFIILSVASFSLLLATPLLTIKIALCVSLLIVLYPLSKRFLKAPQLILGITFGSGSVISYSLQSESFSLSIIILYIGLVAWIISFDSFYALEDIDDDKKIGINSTPILWGDKTIFIANVLHLIFYASLLLIAYLNEFSIFFLFTMGILLLLLYYQNQLAKKELYLNAFKTNNYIGLVAVLGFAAEIFLI